MSKRVQPGDTLVVELALASSSKTPVDFIDLDFEGHESVRLHAGNETPQVRALVHQVARVSEATNLEEGDYRYRASFRIPEDAPATYLGTLAEYRYRMMLHVSIPWWPDVKESFDVVVTPPLSARRPPAPIASTSARGNQPFLEVAVGDRVFGPGDVISGSFAFGNLGGRKPRSLDLSLVGFERVQRDGSDRVVEAFRFTGVKPVGAADEGREVPFRFTVPKDAVPSFDTRGASLLSGAALEWVFEAHLDVRGGADVLHQTRLTIASFDQPAEPVGMRQAVGAGRWHAVWGEVGRRFGLEADGAELQLSGQIEGCDVIVRTGVREGKGGLSAELRWPSWGIGLSIGLKRFIDLSIELGDPSFTRRYRVRGREPSQVRAAIGAQLRRALLAFDEGYVDDEHATVRSETPGHDQPWIGDFLTKVAVLAAAVRVAAERVPPPAAMAGALEAWRAYGAAIGGRLQAGGMSIFGGVIDGASVDLLTEIDRRGEPTGGGVVLYVDPPLPSAISAEDLELGAVVPAAREIVNGLAKRTRSIRIEEREIRVGLAEALADPAGARDVVEAMLALAQALRGDRRIGPYR